VDEHSRIPLFVGLTPTVSVGYPSAERGDTQVVSEPAAGWTAPDLDAGCARRRRDSLGSCGVLGMLPRRREPLADCPAQCYQLRAPNCWLVLATSVLQLGAASRVSFGRARREILILRYSGLSRTT